MTTSRSHDRIAPRVLCGLLLVLVTSSALAQNAIRIIEPGVKHTVVTGQPTLDGRFVVAARADGGSLDSVVVKLNVDGTVLWQRRIAGDAPGGPVADLREAADGSLWLAGSLGLVLFVAFEIVRAMDRRRERAERARDAAGNR